VDFLTGNDSILEISLRLNKILYLNIINSSLKYSNFLLQKE
jgi:hypothetical protein